MDLAIPFPRLGFRVVLPDLRGPQERGDELGSVEVFAVPVVRPVEPECEHLDERSSSHQGIPVELPKAGIQGLASARAVEVEGHVAMPRIDVEPLDGFPDGRDQGSRSSLCRKRVRARAL